MKALLKTFAAAALGGFATGFTNFLSSQSGNLHHAAAVGGIGALTAIVALWNEKPTNGK
jgi:hypothetical protein